MKNTRSRVKSSSDDEDEDEDWSPQSKLANKKRKRPVKKQKTPSLTKISQYSYPSVRSIIVSGDIFKLVRSCPGVQRAHATDDPLGELCNYFVTLMLPSCRFLKNLELELPVTEGLQATIKAFPKVCTLKIHFTSQYFLANQSQFSSLSKFKHLKSLSMDVRTTINNDVKEGIFMWARKLLLELQQKDQKKKWIHMEYTRYSRGYTELKKVNTTLPVPKPIGADDQE
ncbi:hypothetical protein GALMADRAFT_146079 [Galerina marginata CBS 339.88]|uniref:F-box domain-containing protein n=1 Tax=Galerina marginata (strain CBS 339.88) TaxID=685588 RepID=A0A067SPL8_GALM3|nr:hypothetical protein GALMADRAFT_146079 [Galerina marginata CBS 339.88]